MEEKNKNINSKRTWKLVNFCEIDKYATKSYCAIHKVEEKLNLGDITKVDETKLASFNMICGGSPCQDFSMAGKQKGSIWTCKDCNHEYNPLIVHWSNRKKCPKCNSEKIEKTRSSLLIEYLRIIRENKPNFGLYENVKNITSKKFKETFKLLIEELEEYGYNVYWKVLNSKNYGIPQNRERVYIIFINKYLDNGKFKFPEPFDNGIRLKDILEDEVDEKYYISEERMKIIRNNLRDVLEKNFIIEGSKEKILAFSSLTCTMGNRGSKISMIKQIGNIVTTSKWKNPQRGRIFSVEGISPTLNCCKGGGSEPKIVQVCRLNYSQDAIVISGERISHTHTAGHGDTPKLLCNSFLDKENIRIRKLTPKECFRLMGFSDNDFSFAERQVSNSQLYKQTGNSIVVDVLYYILKELYKVMPYLFDDLKLSSFFSGIGAFETALDRLYKDINTNEFYTIKNRLKSVRGKNKFLPIALKYQRTQEAKKMRKNYESGKLKIKRCNIREYTFRNDGICNCITTVTKDNYIAILSLENYL